jgi:UDP-GlcNAc:undecaprenyl-phosphate GlcNAc-1-phosphate transferase
MAAWRPPATDRSRGNESEEHTHTYIWVYFGAAYLALIATPLVIWLARRIGAVDHPGIRSVHCRPIPRIGGVAIYVSSVGLLIPLLFLPNAIGGGFGREPLPVLMLFAAATGVFGIGLIDDLRGLPARFKFVAELAGAGALCLVGVRISDIGLGPGTEIALGWLGWPITLLWIVGVTNAVNMSDGLDGLAAGVAAIACGVIAVFAIHSSTIHTGSARDNDVMMALFALALLGSLSGFLFFNFNPAKVFMGDCGSLFLGFTIASISVMCVSKTAALVGLALPALALGIPLFDTLFSMLRRFLERRSLFAPDRGHFHHCLLAKGLNQRRAVTIIYLATAAAAGAGLLMMTRSDRSILLVFGMVLCLIVLLFHVAGAIRLREVLADLQSKYQYSHQVSAEKRTVENLQLRLRQVRDPSQRWQAVCAAAQRMDFAWVSLKTACADGRTEEQLWRAPGSPPSLSRIITMTIPLSNGDGHAGVSRWCEIAIWANGSVESAGRRATLFGRLLDESELIAPNP